MDIQIPNSIQQKKRPLKTSRSKSMEYGFFVGDCIDFMKDKMHDNVVDLTITSPPYDDLRIYKGYSFQFEDIARQLYRVTKPGGVLVWVVGGQNQKGQKFD